MEPKKQYLEEMNSKFGYFATWIPTTDLKLGDIGVIKGGIEIPLIGKITKGNEFTRVSSLEEQGIKFKIRRDTTPGNLEYSSAGNVTIKAKVSGSLAPEGSVLSALTEADAGVLIEFGDESGVVFKANKVLNPSIENLDALGKEILKRYNNGEWDENWVVITELAQAESATIIISSGGGGKIELKATGEIKPNNIDIADANANFKVVYGKNIHTQVIAQKGLTPLFKVQGIKKKWIVMGESMFKGQSLTLEKVPKKVKMMKVPVFENINFVRENDSQ